MSIKRNPDGSQVIAARALNLKQTVFVRDDGVALMNVDGSISGSATIIWNGTGSLDTGGDWTHSQKGVETSGSAYTGSNGLDSGVVLKNDVSRFDGGADQDIAGSYSTLTFWMMPKAYPAGSKLRVRWATAAGGSHGNRLDVENYTSNMDLDVWQKVTIPISDFGLTTAVDKINFRYGIKDGQHFYFDDIKLWQTGSQNFKTYHTTVSGNVRWHVGHLHLVITAPDAGWNSTGFANGSTLENGLLIRCINTGSGETYWNINIKDNVELFGHTHVANDISFADGERTFSLVAEPSPASVVLSGSTRLEMIVRDDISNITAMRGFAHMGVEELDE
jgi:hypothetical protein